MKKLIAGFIILTVLSANAQTDEKQRLTELMKNFTVISESERDTFYEPAAYQKFKPAQTRLIASVNPRGAIKISSMYFGKEWIQHSSVRIKIADEIFSTERNDSIKKIKLPGGIFNEYVTYSGSNSYLSKMISINQKKEIQISLVGEKTFEYLLTDTEKEAISLTYEVAQLLKK